MHGLASLGVFSKQYDSLLIPVIISKSPTEIRLQIAHKATSDVWKINELPNMIKLEVEAQEVSKGVWSSGNEKQQHSKTKPGSPPTMGSFVANNDKDNFKMRSHITQLHAKRC